MAFWIHSKLICYVFLFEIYYITSAFGDLSIEGYNIHVTPVSGMLNFTRPDGLKLGMSFYELTETDAEGFPIQIPEHSITEGDFNAQNFTVSSPCQKIVIHSTQVLSRYFYYETMLTAKTRLAVEVYFLTSKGYISTNNELTEVVPNDIKITFMISGWDWCRSCDTNDGQSIYGENLDLVFALDLPPGGELRSTGNSSALPKMFSLGNDMKLSLSRKVKRDDGWQTMRGVLPEAKEENGRHFVKVRIPRFEKSGLYDPVISLDVTDEEPRGDPDDVSATQCSGSGNRPPVAGNGPNITGNFVAAILLNILLFVLL